MYKIIVLYKLIKMYYDENEDSYIRYKNLDDDADLFASFFMASPAGLSNEVKNSNHNIENLSKAFHMSVEAMKSRLTIDNIKID